MVYVGIITIARDLAKYNWDQRRNEIDKKTNKM